MKSTSRSPRLVRMAARSPGSSSTGPDVARTAVPISFAMTYASVVLPRPGGPYRRTRTIPQVHERREPTVAQRRALWITGRGRDRCGLRPRQTILQREHDPLRWFLADPGNRRKPREIGLLDRANQIGRLDPGQDRERD